ncbi:MAG: hypothetical protein AAGF48_12860 [Pseudomonadota bacterium]
MDFMKGWKTILFNAGIAAMTVILQGVADIDWVTVVGPEWAVLAVALANMALRAVTDSPIFKAR